MVQFASSQVAAQLAPDVHPKVHRTGPEQQEPQVVPISIRLVRAPTAASSGNGDAS
jgi:hypothetical protein